jgi:hydroxyethylthiazole kinase-like uncharacterized protein yjeF
MKICTVETMRIMDREAVTRYGLSEELLMENAGQAACEMLRREIGIRGKRFLVLCGTGNNGGDGLVVGRKILSAGGSARALIIGRSERFRGPALRNLEIARACGLEISEEPDSAVLERELGGCDAVLDALFGTGLEREVTGAQADVIAAANRSGRRIFSLDIPSGVNGNTGQIMGCAIEAEATVSFGLPKLGNILYPGYAACGRLYVSHISFPPALTADASIPVEVPPLPPLPKRREDAHKKQVGDVLVVAGSAGSAGYYGAPRFCALSFLKAGGGYARLAAPASITPFIAAQAPEVVYAPQSETGGGGLSLANHDRLLELAGRVDLVVLGPGLSLEAETQELVRRLAADIETPLLLDGDGLTALAGMTELLAARRGDTILTPHLGEFARLTGLAPEQIIRERQRILGEQARALNAVIVLKGAHTLIGHPDGLLTVNLSGNSGMATAGSGDVLAGTVAAMVGLGLPAAPAARAGVFIHGLAGDLAAAEKGPDGITALDIMDSLPLAVRHYRQHCERMSNDYNGRIIVL